MRRLNRKVIGSDAKIYKTKLYSAIAYVRKRNASVVIQKNSGMKGKTYSAHRLKESTVS